MIIGVPKEIKNNENRVGMTPAGVAELVKKGHTVYVQATAGANSGFSDYRFQLIELLLVGINRNRRRQEFGMCQIIALAGCNLTSEQIGRAHV